MRRTLNAILLLCLLGPMGHAFGVTQPKGRTMRPQIPLDQIVPAVTQRAGQDLELRRIQTLLSGQKPKSPKSFRLRL